MTEVPTTEERVDSDMLVSPYGDDGGRVTRTTGARRVDSRDATGVSGLLRTRNRTRKTPEPTLKRCPSTRSRIPEASPVLYKREDTLVPTPTVVRTVETISKSRRKDFLPPNIDLLTNGLCPLTTSDRETDFLYNFPSYFTWCFFV